MTEEMIKIRRNASIIMEGTEVHKEGFVHY